ncbi:MAG: hypothetical protein ACRDK1_00645 [Solirubrobacterales bacterium]
MKAQAIAPVPRITLTIEESAAAMGMSVSHFRRHVLPGLKVVYSGSCRVVEVTELQRWAASNATLAGAE